MAISTRCAWRRRDRDCPLLALKVLLHEPNIYLVRDVMVRGLVFEYDVEGSAAAKAQRNAGDVAGDVEGQSDHHWLRTLLFQR